MIALIDLLPERTSLISILCTANAVSARAPTGAGGHRVQFSAAALQDARASLYGLPLTYNGTTIGTIDKVIWAAPTEDLVVHVLLERVDQSGALAALRANASTLSCAYSLGDVEVDDPDADVWEVTRCQFVGISILPDTHLAHHASATVPHATTIEAPSALTWRSGFPEQDGYYWIFYQEILQIVKVDAADPSWFAFHWDGHEFMSNWPGMYLGPLPQPTLPPTP